MSFSVYKSSAGSGKTYTLVREYLKIILLSPRDFRRVLAITFTNKAANEMKTRILSSLQYIAAYERFKDTIAVKFMLPELEKETHLGKKQIASHADKCLQLILHNYSDFGVSTIDSFVHKIIKTFSHDMNLPMNFEVEIDSDELISKVIDILISKVGTDKLLTDFLVKFIHYKTEGDKSWHIERDLGDISKEIMNDEGQTYIEKLGELSLSDFVEIRKKLELSIRKFENEVVDFAKSASDLISAKQLEPFVFFQGSRGIFQYFKNIASRKLDKLEPNTFVRKTIEEDKWTSGKASPSDISSINSIKSELIIAFQKIENLLKTKYSSYLVQSEVLKNLYPLALLNEIEKVMNEYKEDNEIVHISEFNKRIAEIVFKQPIPFIYERMGERYKHFMLDEFQDTSVLQWLNLLPLIENSLASDNFNMLVGDGKQAIYRWRGGEVEQFTHLPKIINKENDSLLRDREESLERNYKPEFLSTNFRSKAEIVQFNNDFFQVISKNLPEGLRSIYDFHEQEFDANNVGGAVRLKFLSNEKEDLSFEKSNLNEILLTIKEVLESGYRLNDVAILCRDNKKASITAAFLLENDISVVSSESLLIQNSAEVRFLFSLLKCLYNGSDYISRVEVITYLHSTKKIEGNFHQLVSNFAKSDVSEFWKLLKSNSFDIFPKALLILPAYDFFEELIRIFKLNKFPNINLQFLLDAVLNIALQKNQSLSEILEWWDKKKEKLSIIVPEGVDAVRVMTIHKAKGLEFPVVIFPYANEKQRNSITKLWVKVKDKAIPELSTALVNTSKRLKETPYNSQLIEEEEKSMLDLVNLLYVTLTRPTDRLYIFTQKPPEKKSETHSISQFFKQYLLEKGKWDENNDVYNWGVITMKNNLFDKNEDLSDFSLNRFISESWRNRMLLSLQASDCWSLDEKSEKKEYGRLIHLILSKINTRDEVSDIMKRLENEGVVNGHESEEISKTIQNVLQKPEVIPFFQEGIKVKNEAGILDKNGKSYRPDRVVFNANEVVVIDFKTGKREKKHLAQISKYKDLLLEMKYRNVRGYLLYINEEKGLVEV